MKMLILKLKKIKIINQKIMKKYHQINHLKQKNYHLMKK